MDVHGFYFKSTSRVVGLTVRVWGTRVPGRIMVSGILFVTTDSMVRLTDC